MKRLIQNKKLVVWEANFFCNRYIFFVSVVFCGIVAGIILGCSSQNTGDSEESIEHEEFARPQISFNPNTYVIYKTDQLIRIDGVIDEEIWQDASWTDNFVPIDGSDAEPEHQTRFKLLWNRVYSKD